MSEKNKNRCRGAVVAAFLLVLMMVVELLSPAVAMAAGVSDGSSANDYRTVLSQGTSTKDSGRVWSDKSVYSEATTELGFQLDLSEGEDFNVVYSAIGSSEKVSGKSDVPLDVMFILDTSGSMENENIIEATDALNTSMINLLESNPYNRVGITTFSNQAEVLLELGRYEQRSSGTPFVSSSGRSVTIKHKGTSRRGVSINVDGGTNTQSGFDAGMKALANEKSTTAEIDGKSVKRAPIVVMLSDGVPTFVCHDQNWWAPENYKNQGDGADPYEGNGMLAMMNAAYSKRIISDHYKVTGTPFETKIYTIGLDVEQDELANITLNPKDEWDSTSNSMSEKIRENWEKYQSGEDVTVRTGSNSKYADFKDSKFTITHPEKNDIKDLADLKYNDAYYSAENAAALDEVFKNIVSDISTSIPDYPTDLKDADPASSGYVTYTDPIGEYMEVKDVKSIVYDGKEYQLKGSIENGFTGTGTIKDPVTGKDVSLEGLTVTVQEEAGNQTLVAKIPAAAIPLKINEVNLKKDGSVESNTTIANPTPIRIVYSVGKKPDVETLSGVSSDYIEKNTENGKVYFYSNKYSGNTDKDGKTIGDAWTEFTPAKDNPNYYFQQDVVIYHDKALENPVTSDESFDQEETYYLGTPYYDGAIVEQAIVRRTGDTFLDAQANGYLVESNGNWALRAETPRNYQIEQDFARTKENNTTNTAERLYSPSVDKQGFVINKIKYNHGNNGKVGVEAPGNLVIKKTVTTESGVPKPDTSYKFKVTIPSIAKRTVIAKVTSGTETVDQEVIFNGSGTSGEIELKDGQYITFPNIIGDYAVEEVDPGQGFTVVKPDNATGKIETGKDTTVEFVNNYKVTPLVVDATEFGFPMTKTMTGRGFSENDQFTFEISGPKGAMPEKAEAVIDGAKVKGQSVAEADFGKFTITRPGTFEYVISEALGEIPGIAYDSSRYKLVVSVEDDGHGNLSVTNSEVFKNIDVDNWAVVSDKKISFTNGYNAESAKVHFVGKKIMENKDLDEFVKPFEFKITAVTKGAPLPSEFDGNDIVPASKTDGTIDFGEVELKTKNLGKTYEYEITEIQPTATGDYDGEALEGAYKDESGNWVYKGVTFDQSTKKISLTVESKEENGKSILVANVTGNNFEFTNGYHAKGEYNFTNAEGGEPGKKFISGRTFNKNDEFTFEVTSEVSKGTISKEATLPKEVKIKPTGGNEIQFDFGSLKFTEQDAGKTFTYTFKEKKGELGGMTYDPSEKVVRLKVTDLNDGTLSIVRKGDALEWTNTYQAKWNYDGIEFAGRKNVTGKEIKEGMFTFSIQGLDGAPLNGGDATNNNIIKSSNGNVSSLWGDPQNMFYILNDQKYTSEDLGGEPEKTFVYEVKELQPSPVQKGMHYDDSVYRVYVKIRDDQQGSLTMSERIRTERLNPNTGKFEETNSLTFNNEYRPEELTIQPFVEDSSLLKKQLEGPRGEGLKANEFKFEFELKSATPEDGVKITNEGQVGNKAPGKDTPNLAEVTFDDSTLTFKEAGTYVFTIKEVDPNMPGLTNITPEIEITYTVKDVDGSLIATPSYTGEVQDGIFVNEYKVEGKVEDDLEVTKVLNGREWTKDDQFEFKLVPSNESTKKAIDDEVIKLPKDTVVIDSKTKDHKAAFGQITITQPGTYEFKISETATELPPGVHPDGVERILTVTAHDNGDGTMKVTSDIKADSAEEKDNLIFTNEYEPNEATLSGKENLSVHKKLAGREWLDSDVFTFTLEAGDEETKAAIGTKVILSQNETATKIAITNQSFNHTEYFDDIIFKAKGNYTFTITESEPEVANVTCDAKPRTLVVEVTDNNAGTLTATVKKTDKDDDLNFTNTYTPTPGVLDGAENLSVTKEMVGRDWLEGETFEFALAAINDEAKSVLPAEEVIAVDSETKTNYFSDLTFTKAGRYEFKVVEKIPEGLENGANGLTYDESEKHVIINITDDHEGNLTITKDEKSDALAFTNSYVPTPLTYVGADNLKVQKILDGREWIKGDRFTFTLNYDYSDPATDAAYKAGDFILPKDRTLDIEYVEGTQADGYVKSFEDITFTKAGTYKFMIAENRGDISGITYDTTVKEFTVNVVDDGYGNLTADSNEISIFTNTYQAEPVVFPADGKGELQVTKIFTGRDWKDTDEFTFVMEPMRTYEPGSFAMSTNECMVKGSDLNKVASFGDITFYKPSPERGYEFLIYEELPDGVGGDGKKDGIQYDQTQKRIAIKVVDDHKGHLQAYVVDSMTDSLVFTNEYKPSDLVILPTQDPKDDGMIGIKLNKILTGRDWKEGDSFSFKIEPLDGAPATSESECTVTRPDQMFDFGILVITQEDMKGATEKLFRYKVTEIIPEDPIPGVNYSAEPIIFVVRASDNGSGFLIAGNGQPDSGLVRNEADGSNSGEFTNVYTPKETTLDGETNLKVVKNFTGRKDNKWKDTDEFTFQLTVSDPETNAAIREGNVILPDHAAKGIKITAKDDVKEKAFGDIVFKKAGTYKFEIAEIDQKIAGVTYAPAQEVVVNVTDNQDGKLVAAVQDGTQLKPFENVYNTGSDTLSGKDHLNVVKEIEGRDWTEGDSFTFTIEPNNELTTNAIAAGEIVMPNEDELTVTIDDKTIGHTKNFGNIIFTKSQDYEFKVTETLPEEGTKVDGIVYDAEPQIVKVSVKDMGDGTLKAETETEKLTFVNKYEHDTAVLDGSTNLNIKKQIENIYQWTDSDEFEFYITANNELAKKVELPQSIVINGSSDEVYGQYGQYQNHFSDMTFEEPGVYEFYIHEKVPANKIPGMVYDTTPRKLVVTVTDDYKGHLTATTDAQEFSFINRYKPAPTKISGLENLKVIKQLHGRPWLPGDHFKFTLVPDEETAARNTATHTAFELPENADGLTISYDPVLDSGDYGNSSNPHVGNFGNIKFYDEGIYTFTVSETNEMLPNLTYDQRSYEFTINVYSEREGENAGKLIATIHDLRSEGFNYIDDYYSNGNAVKFQNKYAAKDAVLDGTNVTVKKELLGREWKPGDEFEFKLEDTDLFANCVLPDPNVIKIAYNEEGDYTAHFGDILFKEAGTYTLKISEVVPETPIPGMNYAGYQNLKVKVTDDLHGQLHAEVVGDKTYEFTNSYQAENGVLDGKTNLQVEKVFEGREEWQDSDSFTFKLSAKTEATKKAVDEGIVVLGTNEVTIDQLDQIASFGDLEFTKAGSYVFEVAEVIPEDAPSYIDYDQSKKTIVVEVRDDLEGHLVAELSDTDATSVFTNRYAPKSVTLDGKENLEVTKVMSGRDWTKGDTFLFTMSAADEKTTAAIADNSIVVPSNFDEISISDTDKDKKEAFGDLIFKKAGTYTFKVSEKPGTIPAVTYDDVDRFVTVVVTDDTKGNLSIESVTVKADEAEDNLIFTNTYTTTPYDLNGETNLKVVKVIEGREWTEDDSFSFKLEAANEAAKTVLTAAENITIDAEAPDHMAHFGNLQFTKAGEYQFKITEVLPEGSAETGFTYAEPIEFTVSVKDNLKGALTATVDHKGAFEFVNVYDPKAASLEGATNLNVKKTFTGMDWYEGLEFTFNLKPIGSTKGNKSVKNAEQEITISSADLANASVTGEGQNVTTVVEKAFADLTFEKKGEYSFEITEKDNKVQGITYAKNKARIDVKVTDDPTQGKLVATVMDTSDVIEFTNTYKADPVVIGPDQEQAIELTKVLEGREMTANDKWSFTITKAQDTADKTPLPKETTVQNDMDKVVFGNITYTTPGVYKYVITESGFVTGVKNDETASANVTVEITYDAATGALTPTLTYEKQQFVNTYKVKPVDISGREYFQVKKKLTGREWKAEDQFTFTMKADPEDPFTVNEVANGEIVLPGEITINANSEDEDGLKTNHFADMIFKKAGTYRFIIAEDQTPSISGVQFDTTKHKVMVDVTENQVEGTLQAMVAPASVTFENIYKASDVTIEGKDAFAFSKVLEGRDWTDEDVFTFTLTGEENAPMPEKTEVSVSKPEDGKAAAFNFGEIHFTVEDLVDAKTKTFTYVVKEVVPEDVQGILYDQAERTVMITVTDDGTGVLKTSVALEGDRTFTNTYRADANYGEAAGETAFRITKNLENHALAKGQFTFVITGNDERSKEKLDSIGGTNGVMEVSNEESPVGEDGIATWSVRPFDSMTFVKDKETDETGKYSFTVTEKAGNAAGYTYDNASHTVEINVTDSKAGGLSITTDEYDVVFNNSYKADGSLGGDSAVKILATKTLNGRQMADKEFKFEVVNLKNEQVVSKGQNIGSTVVFDEIQYSLDTIEESGYESKEMVNGNAVYNFSYVVKEVLPVSEGVTANTPQFSIAVKVADDGEGNLVPTVIYPEGTGSLDFVNTYNADSVSVQISAAKELETADGAEITLEDIAGKFEFVMEADGATYNALEEEVPYVMEKETAEPEVEEQQEKTVAKTIANPMPNNTKAKNDKAGNVSFDPISFDLSLFDDVQPKEDGSREIVFHYKVTERGAVDGIQNDPNAKAFAITVIDDGKGHISAVLDEKNGLVFKNTYSFTSETSSLTGSGQFAMNKTLEGRDLKEAEFKFELKDVDGQVKAEGQNTADGLVEMGAVTFTKPGTYVYTLSEVNGGKKLDNGVQYDGTVYQVSAFVKDAKNGHLGVTWEVKDLENKEIVFKNIYDPKATAATLGANKILSGRDLKDQEFTFTLKDENGKILQTVKNDKDGRIPFEKMKYNKAGTWKYTIEEVKGNDKDIKYDDTEYKLTVNVIDDGIGFLRAEIVNDNGAVIFHNIYEKPETSIKPSTPEVSAGTPVGGSPASAARTGDTSDITLWAVLMMLAAAGAAGVIGNKKRKIG